MKHEWGLKYSWNFLSGKLLVYTLLSASGLRCLWFPLHLYSASELILVRMDYSESRKPRAENQKAEAAEERSWKISYDKISGRSHFPHKDLDPDLFFD